MKRKMFSLLFAIILMFSICNTTVLAAYEQTYFANESRIKILNQNNIWHRNALMPLVSMIAQDEVSGKKIGEFTTWGGSQIALKEECIIMHSLLGDEFEDKKAELYKNRYDQYAHIFRQVDNVYDADRAMHVLYSMGLELVRNRIGKENINASDSNKYVIRGLINLLGYRTMAENKGGFPDGYLKVANEIGLTKGLSFDPDAYVTYKFFEAVLMNALAIPLCLSQKEIDTDKRYYKRLLYARDEYAEICDGTGPSGKYRTLMNMHLNSIIAEGVLTQGSKGYKFKINKTMDFNGKEIKNTAGESVYVNVGEIPFNKVSDRKSIAVIQLNKEGKADLLGITCDNYSLSIKTKKGKTSGLSTINNVQGTGDTFVFTAVTPNNITEISFLADLYNGNQWHEIPYDYLKKHYKLNYTINSNNEKVWTCQFGINDPGYRTFVLKVKANTAFVRTFMTANVNVEKNTGSSSQSNNSTSPYRVTMYAPDGRTATVYIHQVESWLEVGWYTHPVKTVYALDGRSINVSTYSLEEWLKVGWYIAPVIKVYAPDGRSTIIYKHEEAAWKKVGWSRK